MLTEAHTLPRSPRQTAETLDFKLCGRPVPGAGRDWSSEMQKRARLDLDLMFTFPSKQLLGEMLLLWEKPPLPPFCKAGYAPGSVFFTLVAELQTKTPLWGPHWDSACLSISAPFENSAHGLLPSLPRTCSDVSVISCP